MNISDVAKLAGVSPAAVSLGRIAECLGAEAGEITFTSGGSEADNQAIRSAAALGAKQRKRHLTSTAFEHHAVLHTLKKLESEGLTVTLLDVGGRGLVTPEQVREAIHPDTRLVSVMYANNAIGTVRPVKGIGALYARKGVSLTNLIEGGAQERGKRAGTENMPAVMSMAAALVEACAHREENAARTAALRDRLIGGLSRIPHSVLNGDPVQRLPGNVNFCFEGIEGESLLLHLDDRGICASSGSACTSGSLDPSHVLLAIGRPHEIAHGSLRLAISGVEFEHSQYQKLKKVTSIWICTTPPMERCNTITRYRLAEENLVGDVKETASDYDLLSVVMVCLGGPVNGRYAGLLRLLHVLLSSEIGEAEKKRILEGEFGIPVTETLETEVNQMCNLSQGVREEGRMEGREETRIDSIRKLMSNMGLTLEKTMEVLEIPEADRPKYANLLQRQ